MAFRTSDNKILIQINAIVPDDADNFHGAEIEDFDRDKLQALLLVDEDEIHADVSVHREVFTDEAWGQVAVFTEEFIEVISCKWNGFDIINAEEVCQELHHEI
jgi:hypothetical protein